jgi:hypothetical protein
MKMRVKYRFEGRDVDFITNPLATALYDSFEQYRAEILKWFPGATVEVIDDEQQAR